MSATQCAVVRGEGKPLRTSARTVWIDLDNSPHVPFFAPIIQALEQLGHSVFVTARDCFQVCELAELMNLRYHKVGYHYGKHTLIKLIGLGTRALQLAPAVSRARPDLAVSHGSRSQLLLSSILRIPALTIGDYEHAKVWAVIHPRWVIVPEVIPAEAWAIAPERVLKYPGIKEDVYVPRFQPDSRLLGELGLSPQDLVVTVRPPATEAHYYNPESERIFEAVMDRLAEAADAHVVLLPRTAAQGQQIRQRWSQQFASGAMMIPEHVVDGLNLIWFSDLVISGGGTMNREAAALHVPVYSTFRGKIGAVDHYLVEQKRLVLIESPADVREKIRLEHRQRHERPPVNGLTLDTIVQYIVSVLEKECRTRP